MLTNIVSCAVIGLDGETITIEVDVSAGYPTFIVVGLPDAAVSESRQRIPTAIRNSGFKYPYSKRVVVNLAPADLKKEGASYDLPIAVGILFSTEQIRADVSRSIFVGELALDGSVRPARGVLPVSLWARDAGYDFLYVPAANAAEASVVAGIRVMPVATLSQLVAHLNGPGAIFPAEKLPFAGAARAQHHIDFSDIAGQEHAKRALEIAAAGSHNVAMSGPPGSGKTMLSGAMVTILPDLTFEEQLEVTKIYSIAGCLPPDTPLVRSRPFRSPHHTASGIALVGGGAYPRPGEISLAHRGVLFLDEFAEFSRSVLENLRQPLEDGRITVSRAQGSVTFPARFILVASFNPCPCGFLGDAERNCVCTQGQINKYRTRISGPIADRIDLHVEVPRLPFEKLEGGGRETSGEIRERVNRARAVQYGRLKECGALTNSEMNAPLVRKLCALDAPSRSLIRQAVDMLHLSARGFHRVLKVSRTIADLAGEPSITVSHIAEALQYRPKDD
ncbi:MAG: YifB family Mg chelatase-like AAA ATPase [Candidatus Sungbacteria bacterium]|uniref:YifB family Mg chelatase-like AAA ATPase n=1 Tax=Candidatus Sungiibacteriota bacterium TaxID=2750080 RepID=A0A932YZP1_9BACT|nr:YifB family Mg chelatase-like AAA ATPase [Parcubacteria group bacterium]MBI4132935.1 YifB family Mg chelatase-like AAA ATPase [Candidatus Sungbacteria bacterium]